jgi:hypothetical protein
MTRRAAALTNLFLSLALATGLLCAATGASAQTTTKVTIPFGFSAGHQYVPAGSYQVQLLSDRFLSLRNIKTDKTQVVMVRPESGQVTETQGRLVFQRHEGRLSLKQVWIAGTNMHSELVCAHGSEPTVAKGTPPPDSTIELALK